jgi:biopolymer transport protein ExbD
MAEIQSNQEQGISKRKKHSTRVDLTPMVDLGFLLITFFIFTTSLTKPNAMKVNLPNETDITHPTNVPDSKVITIFPKGNNMLSYYFGDNVASMQETNWGENGIRKILIEKKQQVAAKYGDGKEMIVLIKPTEQSTYQNLIDMLDEMLINDITRYMLLDASAAELAIVKN